jgi:ABC-type phosphate/phosphonate transport system substrate-binding protein
VNKDRSFKDLRDLRGETIVILDAVRTSLAPLWLDTELMRSRLPVSAHYFGKISLVKKPNLAILPVFFKQAGVALVSRNSFQMAGELNPQLVKELRVLATSPDVIPSIGAFRANAVSGAVDLYRREALRLGDSPGGKLVLNLFQTDGVVEINESDLAGTRALLAEHARLKAAGK